MEKTGFKDKNGRDICDGDTLRVPMEFGRDTVVVKKYAFGNWGLAGREMYLSELVEDREVI